MKKILTLAVAAVLFTGVCYAYGDGKNCCKKNSKKECCAKKGEKKVAAVAKKA